VCGRRRGDLRRGLQNASDERLARLGGPSTAGRILGEPGEALGNNAVPPEAHCLPTCVQGRGNVLIRVALGRQQGNLGAKHQPRRRPSSASPLR
jgi:hypothetical protein